VTDRTANAALRFGSTGNYEGRVGSSGPGPHELLGITNVFLAPTQLDGREVVGVTDLRTSEVKWFEPREGSLVHMSR